MVETERIAWKTEEDLLQIVQWALALSGVLEIVVRPGIVLVKKSTAESVEPPASLSSDDLFQRVRQSSGIKMALVIGPNMRDALIIAMTMIHREGLQPTHLLCRSKDEMCEALILPRPSDQGFLENRTVYGFEVAESPDLPPGTFFLCAGTRRRGTAMDVTHVVRLEGD